MLSPLASCDEADRAPALRRFCASGSNPRREVLHELPGRYKVISDDWQAGLRRGPQDGVRSRLHEAFLHRDGRGMGCKRCLEPTLPSGGS